MLALNLRQIRSGHERFEQVYQPDALPETDDYQIAGPVALTFDIYKDKQQFRLVGRVRTTLDLACSRCLEPFAWPVDSEFDLRYQPHTHNAGEGEREIEEDDLTTAFYDNDEIALDQLMQEQLYLSLPMKPLCSEDCKGLCPVSGTNLSRGQCACLPRWEDPRLAPLKALKKES